MRHILQADLDKGNLQYYLYIIYRIYEIYLDNFCKNAFQWSQNKYCETNTKVL